MATIVMLDQGSFDLTSLQKGPLGGAETAFIELVKALANRGNNVVVRNNCKVANHRENIDWAPLGSVPQEADLVIANRSPAHLSLIPHAKNKVLWLHNTAKYLFRWYHYVKLLQFRPTVVFSGTYHLSTYSRWFPHRRKVIIPYGISELFRGVDVDDNVPPPRAIFTSNPLRSLDWLVDVWMEYIHPQVPDAELHVFSGPQTYGGWGAKVTPLMTPVLEKVKRHTTHRIILHEPLPKHKLIKELQTSRVLLYRGVLEETFCLAVAEAQAAGVPCVVQNWGSLSERVLDNVTGFVAKNDEEFCKHAIALLTDKDLWLRQHRAAVEFQRVWGWDKAAEAFETLL